MGAKVIDFGKKLHLGQYYIYIYKIKMKALARLSTYVYPNDPAHVTCVNTVWEILS